ncbi:mercuric reductase [Cupriavidus basilensis]
MAQGFDAIIIGTGQAGPALAARLAGTGMKLGRHRARAFWRHLREHRLHSHQDPHCKRVRSPTGAAGCRIRRDDRWAGRRRHETREGTQGRNLGPVSSGVEQWMRGLENVTVYQGHARFESAHSVRVNGDLLEAGQIFVNVGGRALVPPMPGLDQVPYLTNAGMMDVDFLPQHLIVIGGSYIGLEFGQMYRRFGARVTIVEKGSRLIQREDEDVSQAVREILEAEGIEIRLNANCLSARRNGDHIAVGLDCAAGAPEVHGSHLLLAVGRVPNTDDLGLDKAGVETDARGYIKVDEQLRTSVPGIWALGDCNGRGAFTHTSYNDHEIVAANLLDNDPRAVSDRIAAYAMFIDPPLGRAGMTESEARQSGRKVLVGTRPMSRVGRAVERGESLGFIESGGRPPTPG